MTTQKPRRQTRLLKKKLTEKSPLTAAKIEKAVGPKALGFSLKDQKELSSLIQFPKNRITVLAFADREGAAQMEKWIQPLYAKYTDQIDIHGIAQSIVSGLAKYPVMLDWDGNISQAYKVEKAKTNLYLFQNPIFAPTYPLEQ